MCFTRSVLPLSVWPFGSRCAVLFVSCKMPLITVLHFFPATGDNNCFNKLWHGPSLRLTSAGNINNTLQVHFD